MFFGHAVAQRPQPLQRSVITVILAMGITAPFCGKRFQAISENPLPGFALLVPIPFEQGKGTDQIGMRLVYMKIIPPTKA